MDWVSVTNMYVRTLLHIATNQVRKPEVLYQDVVEIEERVLLVPSSADKEEDGDGDEANVVVGVTGERVRVEKPVDEEQVRAQLQAVYDKVGGRLRVIELNLFIGIPPYQTLSLHPTPNKP